jgi:hypothetical protein
VNTCKTCAYWKKPTEKDYAEEHLCNPTDPNTYEPMNRGFEVRICKMPTQTFCEPPVERNGFGLADGSTFYAVLATAEDFGCVRHELP